MNMKIDNFYNAGMQEQLKTESIALWIQVPTKHRVTEANY